MTEEQIREIVRDEVKQALDSFTRQMPDNLAASWAKGIQRPSKD